MKRKLIALALAFAMSYALLLPAYAESIGETKSSTTTVTMEVPDITYTLSVPANCDIAYENGDLGYYRELGNVEIKDAVRFTESNYVRVKAEHTSFTCPDTKTTLSYNLYSVAQKSGTEGNWSLSNLSDISSSSYCSYCIQFYPKNTSYTTPFYSEQTIDSYSKAVFVKACNTVPIRLCLNSSDYAVLEPGTYTSTITFYATLH